MELISYWKIIRKRLWLIVLLPLLGGGFITYLSMQSVLQYRTTTTLFLNPAAASPLLPFQTTRTVESVANTYIEFMRTRSFAQLVAEQSNLALSPEIILVTLTTQYVPNTQFFRITATYTDPQTAQILANTAAQVLISQNIARQQAEQDQLRTQRNQNPEVQQLVEMRNSLQSELKLYDQKIADSQTQISNLELRSPSERTEQRITSLREEMVGLQTSRAQVLTSLSQTQSALVTSGVSALGGAPDTAVVVDAAPLPTQPLPGNVGERSLLAVVVFLTIAIAIVFLLEYLDYTIRTPEMLEQTYGMQTRGVIGIVDPWQGNNTEPNPNYQLTVSEPRSPAAESIRALRTSVQVAGLLSPIRTLLITSAGPGEGKTFVAANLAVSLAQYGSRVILVDADLRKPNLHTVFGLPREPGLTNLVVGSQQETVVKLSPRLIKIAERANNRDVLRQRYYPTRESRHTVLSLTTAQNLLNDLETDEPDVLAAVAAARNEIASGDDAWNYLQPTNIENLQVLTCGAIPPNPSELLGSPRTVHVMEQLNALADIVIYDSPPAATVTDAVIMASHVDGVLQIVRAGMTRIDVVRRCKVVLEHVNARILGPVLNQVRLPDLGYYSYYYSSYYAENGERRTSRGVIDRLVAYQSARKAPSNGVGSHAHED